MFSSVYTKTLYNLRWQLLGWGLGFAFLTFFVMFFYPSFNQKGIEDIINAMPESLKSLMGSVESYKTVAGYLGQQIFGTHLVIYTMVMSIVLFTSVSASDEDRGTLQSLLSLPVTRTAVYFQKWLAVITIIALVCLCSVAGIYAALLLINESADLSRVLLSTLDFFLIEVVYGVIAYMIAMLTGKKSLTVAIASAYTGISFIVTALAPSVSKLKTVDYFSLFHYYNNPPTMTNGLNATHILIVVAIIILCTLIGWIGFMRRSIT